MSWRVVRRERADAEGLAVVNSTGATVCERFWPDAVPRSARRTFARIVRLERAERTRERERARARSRPLVATGARTVGTGTCRRK